MSAKWEDFRTCFKAQQLDALNKGKYTFESIWPTQKWLKCLFKFHQLTKDPTSPKYPSGITNEWEKNYVVRLCNVYRYLLEQTPETNLVNVYKEVEFIKSYIHLLKERFDDGVLVEIHLEDQILDRKIPPMALQTLIENAVKHNVTMTSAPLKIEIFSDQNHIVVKNDLCFKNNMGFYVTKGIGIQNLSERYRLITKEPVVVFEDENCFTVRIATI